MMQARDGKRLSVGSIVVVLLLPAVWYAGWYAGRRSTQTPGASPVASRMLVKVVTEKANENAARSSCQSNLKQIALGMMQYVQDNGEMYPYANQWWDGIQIYVKDEKILHCPSLKPGDKYGYAMNGKLSRKGLANMWAPSQTVQLYESSTSKRNHFGEGKDLAFRHLGGANYAYVDGHVQWHAQDKPQQFLLSITHTETPNPRGAL
jgi:prepilin-type processing-associated H-X9-DG protein